MIDLDEALESEIRKFVLSRVVQALDPGTAHRLVSQLDDALQEDLFEVVPGQEPTMSLSALLDDLIARFGLTEEVAQAALVHVAMELMKRLDERDLARLRKHLPDELRMLFIGMARAAA